MGSPESIADDNLDRQIDRKSKLSVDFLGPRYIICNKSGQKLPSQQGLSDNVVTIFIVGFRGFTSGLYWIPWVNLSPKFTDLMDQKMSRTFLRKLSNYADVLDHEWLFHS